MIEAIAQKFQTGTQWVRPPERYGNWRGVCTRLRCGLSTAPLTTKTPLAADARCRPLACILTEARWVDDAPAFVDVMARLRAPRRRDGLARKCPRIAREERALSARTRSGLVPAQVLDRRLHHLRPPPHQEQTQNLTKYH
ncbi:MULTISPECIES: hypothetical protein [Streptomyces]|uniref:hypothetical protein n=1 Tax=Streptomyces TaxID=1883 RepID=UPI001E2D274F|nr:MULTISPECIES: hypothetical protein [Streptomyces]UFQ19311.1 hypothetical protein J2N69_32490 [Streptomyces huasconensis]WCL88931.1 hypothetical protein PPN52_32440 [Streptomyces sp. JCM 35825]